MAQFFDGLARIYGAIHLKRNVKYDQIVQAVYDTLGLSWCAIYFRPHTSHYYRQIANSQQDSIHPKEFESNPFGDDASMHAIRSSGDVNVGFLVCFFDATPNPNQRRYLEVVCSILSREFEHDHIFRLFQQMTKQISVNLLEQDFYNALITLVGKAGNVPFAAMRRYQETEDRKKSMECIAGYSHDPTNKINCESLTFRDGDVLLKAFTETMEHSPPHCAVYNDSNSEILRELTSKPPFEDVKTILIAPLVVGDKRLGTISFGFFHAMVFSAFEKSSYLAIANWAGSALSNYEEMQAYAEMEKSRYTEFKAEVANEMIQGLRHGAKNNLEIVDIALDEAIEELDKFNSRSRKKFTEPLDSLGICRESVTEAIKDINNMSFVAQQKELIPESFKLVNIFERSKALVRYSLNQEKIDVVEQVSPKLVASVDGTSFVYAMVNLFLNSIDAFRRGFIKSNRRINISASIVTDTKKGRASDTIKIIFADNAGGVRNSSAATLDDPKDIWKVGFSTKKKGSGMGLPYVRRVFQSQHKGNVQFITDKTGTQFEIQFPRGTQKKPCQ